MATEQRVPTTSAEIDAIFARVKNWERRGADDERGALNFITPAVRQRAAATVREGDQSGATGSPDHFAIALDGYAHTHLLTDQARRARLITAASRRTRRRPRPLPSGNAHRRHTPKG
jgi:hypothetical protein